MRPDSLAYHTRNTAAHREILIVGHVQRADGGNGRHVENVPPRSARKSPPARCTTSPVASASRKAARSLNKKKTGWLAVPPLPWPARASRLLVRSLSQSRTTCILQTPDQSACFRRGPVWPVPYSNGRLYLRIGFTGGVFAIVSPLPASRTLAMRRLPKFCANHPDPIFPELPGVRGRRKKGRIDPRQSDPYHDYNGSARNRARVPHG